MNFFGVFFAPTPHEQPPSENKVKLIPLENEHVLEQITFPLIGYVQTHIENADNISVHLNNWEIEIIKHYLEFYPHIYSQISGCIDNFSAQKEINIGNVFQLIHIISVILENQSEMSNNTNIQIVNILEFIMKIIIQYKVIKINENEKNLWENVFRTVFELLKFRMKTKMETPERKNTSQTPNLFNNDKLGFQPHPIMPPPVILPNVVTASTKTSFPTSPKKNEFGRFSQCCCFLL